MKRPSPWQVILALPYIALFTCSIVWELFRPE